MLRHHGTLPEPAGNVGFRLAIRHKRRSIFHEPRRTASTVLVGRLPHQEPPIATHVIRVQRGTFACRDRAHGRVKLSQINVEAALRCARASLPTHCFASSSALGWKRTERSATSVRPRRSRTTSQGIIWTQRRIPDAGALLDVDTPGLLDCPLRLPTRGLR